MPVCLNVRNGSKADRPLPRCAFRLGMSHMGGKRTFGLRRNAVRKSLGAEDFCPIDGVRHASSVPAELEELLSVTLAERKAHDPRSSPRGDPFELEAALYGGPAKERRDLSLYGALDGFQRCILGKSGDLRVILSRIETKEDCSAI